MGEEQDKEREAPKGTSPKGPVTFRDATACDESGLWVQCPLSTAPVLQCRPMAGLPSWCGGGSKMAPRESCIQYSCLRHQAGLTPWSGEYGRSSTLWLPGLG